MLVVGLWYRLLFITKNQVTGLMQVFIAGLQQVLILQVVGQVQKQLLIQKTLVGITTHLQIMKIPFLTLSGMALENRQLTYLTPLEKR